MKTAAIGILSVCLALPAAAQSGDLSDVLSGKRVPLTLKLRELNGEWSHISIIPTTGKAGGGGGLSSLMQLAALGSKNGGKDDPAAAMMGLSMLGGLFGGGGDSEAVTYYTRGQTVALGGETFMVAYQYKKPELNLASLAADAARNGGKEPDFSKMAAEGKMSAESALSMTLVNLRTVGTMKDVRPFDMAKEIEEANKENGLLDLIAASEKEKASKSAELTPTRPATARPATKPVRPAPRGR